MNANFLKISRFLPNAIHKHVFPLDFSPAIDFKAEGLDPGFLSLKTLPDFLTQLRRQSEIHCSR
jgi:hypothetical protein